MLGKERYWTFVVYPESVRNDWKDYIQSLGIQCAISPLHNKDINTNGEIKKPHFHVLVCFNGPTTYNKVKTLICDYIGATIPQRVLSCKGMIRYFTHKDNPEKTQYEDADIITLNGLDLKTFSDLTVSQILFIKKEIVKYINENKIYSYDYLVDLYAYDTSMNDYFQVLSNNTIFFNTYIKCRKERFKDESR